MPQDLQSLNEHDLILKNVESLRAAVEEKVNGEVTTQNVLLHPDLVSQKWQELECKNVELHCHIDFFERAFETQQKSALAYTTADIEKLLESNKKLESAFTSQKDQLHVLHSIADELVQLCQTTDAKRVKGFLEATDQKWNHVLCSLKGQAKFLEKKLNAFFGFDANLKDFVLWLGKMETTLQYLDEVTQNSLSTDGSDSGEFRKSVKSVYSEMDAHEKILESLNSTGNQMIFGLQSDGKASLQTQLDDLNQRWNKLRARCETIQKFETRLRQEKQLKAFNLLLQKLIELDVWLKCIEDELCELTVRGSDLTVLNKQADRYRDLWQQLESKASQVENYLRLGKQSLEKVSEQASSDPEEMRLLSDTVGEHLTQMKGKWMYIREILREQQVGVYGAINRLEVMETKLAEAKQLLDLLDGTKSKWLPVDDIIPTNLQAAVNQTRFFESELIPLKVKVSECNAAVKLLQNNNLTASEKNADQLEDMNQKLNTLESVVEDRLNLLMIAALKKIDPATQHQLALTVTYPWKRAVTDGKHVPYYINHDSETTQWNHPEMASIIQSLDELNNIKFSAYRTAMKLCILQKRLSLGKLNGAKLLELFKQQGLGSNDRPMTVTDMVKCLTSAFGDLKTDDSKFNVPLAIDLVLNWLLNVFDRSRTGNVWPASFKVALLLMSSGSLDDKYRAIFSVIADQTGTIDQFRLSLLLQDIVLIPKQLGEAAAFGGTNVDATVNSCFEKVNNRVGVDVRHFINWMKLEPQSLVWISVMHRLAETEQTSHQGRCSVCKTSPIIGLRYRCLRCFSFDMCQSCFFLGRTVKGHNLTHPMQEYATPTTSGEDMRDISKVLKNKFRSQQYYKRHPRLGYLPVQSATDLAPKESLALASQQTSNSTTTLEMHSRLELYASRLAELEKRKPSLSECEDEHELIGQLCHSLGGGSTHSFQLQSPMQIMMALDSDQKSELDNVMRELEEENRVLQAEYDLLRQESKCLGSKGTYDNNNSDEMLSAEGQNPDLEMIAEAKILRLYKERLETRMEILEDHNSRLNSQLQRLRQLLSDQSGSSYHSIVYPLTQTMTAPVMSSSSSQNSLPRRGPPSFSSSMRCSHQSLKEQPLASQSSLERDNSVHGGQRLDSLEHNSESNVSDEVFDVANVGRALDCLIDGITSYVDSTTKEERV